MSRLSIEIKTLKAFTFYLKNIFSLEEDKANETEIIDSIKKGVEFKGTNLWALIFSILIASIGLNVNSTAVIIGAMLISPLMGPIMGIGLGIGIYDFDLIKKSIKNLLTAVIISIIVSSIYFFISPLKDTSSEILSRTTPTIWDVFIALFGGLAGIVAGSRKDKGNAIPGVAIATALMPPICTASFGIATGNVYFFLGAFYLFFINSVFISFATFIIVRLLKFEKKTFLNLLMEKKVKRYIAIFLFVTIIPSIFIGYKIVNEAYLSKKIENFIKTELNYDKFSIIDKKIDSEKKSIKILYIGKSFSIDETNLISLKLNSYIKGAKIALINAQIEEDRKKLGYDIKDIVFEELYKKNYQIIKEKDKEILELKNKLGEQNKEKETLKTQIEEIYLIFPEIKSVSMLRGLEKDKDNYKDKLLIILKGNLANRDKIRIKNWYINKNKNYNTSVVFE